MIWVLLPLIHQHYRETDENGGPAWLVRLNSAAEAHRLVRRYHMTVMDINEESLVQARIIY